MTDREEIEALRREVADLRETVRALTVALAQTQGVTIEQHHHYPPAPPPYIKQQIFAPPTWPWSRTSDPLPPRPVITSQNGVIQ